MKSPLDRGGFALLEASTALFIAVTGLFGAFQMFQYGVDKIRVIHEYRIAARAIENELETLRAQPFDALEAAADCPFLSVTPEVAALPALRARSAIRPDSVAPARLKEVSITLLWRTENGRQVERRLTALISKRDDP